MHHNEGTAPSRYVLTDGTTVIVTDDPKEADRLAVRSTIARNVTVTHVGAGWQRWSDGVTTSGLWAGLRPPSKLLPSATAARLHCREFLSEALLNPAWASFTDDPAPAEDLRAALAPVADQPAVRARRVHDEDVPHEQHQVDQRRYWLTVDRYVYGDSEVFAATAGGRQFGSEPLVSTSCQVFNEADKAIAWAREEVRFILG